MNGTFIQVLLKDYKTDLSHEDNIEIIRKFNKTTLLTTIEYLNVTFRGKHYNMTKLSKPRGVTYQRRLATIICNKIRSFLNIKCNMCYMTYIPELEETQDTSSCCSSCGIIRHSCARNIPPAYPWICQNCSEYISPPYLNYLRETDESINESDASLESSEEEETDYISQSTSNTTPPLPQSINTNTHPPPLYETSDGSDASQEYNEGAETDYISQSDSTTTTPPPQSRNTNTLSPPLYEASDRSDASQEFNEVEETDYSSQSTSTTTTPPPQPRNTNTPPPPFYETSTLHQPAPSTTLSHPNEMEKIDDSNPHSHTTTPPPQPLRVHPHRDTAQSNLQHHAATSRNSAQSNTQHPTGTFSSQTTKHTVLCPYLKRGVCRYGPWGLKGGRCPNFHPEPCEKFMNYGAVLPSGCDKGVRCEYYHLPFFCENSTKYLWCDIKNCSDLHHYYCSDMKPLIPTHTESPSKPPSPLPLSHSRPIPTLLSPTPSPLSHPSPNQPTSPISPTPSTPTTPTAIPPTPHQSTPLPSPTNHTRINNHQPTSRPVPPPQNFIPSIPNYHPPPFLSPFHPPFYPMPPYLPHHLPIPYLYPPKPQVVAPQPNPSQHMMISPRIVSALEDLITQMKNGRNN